MVHGMLKPLMEALHTGRPIGVQQQPSHCIVLSQMAACAIVSLRDVHYSLALYYPHSFANS